MDVIEWNKLTKQQQDAALARPSVQEYPQIAAQVAAVMAAVGAEGDAAVGRYTQQFDGVQLEDFQVAPAAITAAYHAVPQATVEAIEANATRIRRYHAMGEPTGYEVETAPGVRCFTRWRPIEAVGLYIPGGLAPLPSTVLMLAIPAVIAGCRRIVLCTPPRRDGSIDPHILVAADLCGVEQIFAVGGAQAIAAMTHGTKTVPKVHKIFGPGNRYVTAAKLQATQLPGGPACDLPAGPSEVCVIADEQANPEFIAADLLAQLEHGTDSQAILVTPAASLMGAVQQELSRQTATLPRQEILEASLANLKLIQVASLEQAYRVANAYAPEHLICQHDDPLAWVGAVQNAGSVFLGPYAPETVGDYGSGPNHVLPTGGAARAYSGVTVGAYMKQVSFQELAPAGLLGVADSIMALATVEGLEAHRQAVAVRVAQLQQPGLGRPEEANREAIL